MQSISPTKHMTNQIIPSHQSVFGCTKPKNIFEVLNSKFDKNEYSDETQVVSRLRTLRYQNMTNGSPDTVYADTSIQEKQENESFIKGSDVKDLRQRHVQKQSTGSYLSSYQFITGNENFYHRRKQPSQTKMADLSKEHVGIKVSDSEDEVDSITNEELGEHSSQEKPFRQPIHQTKSALQLLKINSEGSPISGVACSHSETNTGRYE